MDDIVSDFVAETREGIETLDSELVRFEQDPGNPLILDGVFRLIHTIKGTCGFIGLNRLQAIAHAAETVLGGFRDGSLAVTTEGVTAILQAVDLIREIVEGLAQTGLEPTGDDTVLVGRLDAAARPAAGPAPAELLVPSPPEPAPPAGPLLERLGGEASLDAACEMTVAALASMDVAASAWTGIDPDRLQSVLRAALCDAARGLADAAALRAELHVLLDEAPDDAFVGSLLVQVGCDLRALDIADPDIYAVMAALAWPPAEVALAAPVPTPPPAAVQHKTPAPAPKAAEASPKPAPQAPKPAAAQPVPTTATAPPAESEGGVTQTIRVSVDALEHLMTVASELVLIRNQLLQRLRDDPESEFAAPLHRLNQVTSELQEGVMTTRMQPISGAWAKLPRLVRDLSSDLGKQIDLVLLGQETELDRQVLELIKDPLTHMIRNAADHGLETPAERLAAGKPAVGKITLSARHEGGAIVIEVGDDGRGLPAGRIRAKAVENGLISTQQAEALSDVDARRMIFLAGFSTAAEVTAVSGRGVGMDVVRTNIEKIGGVIELSSTEGLGTQFTIRIPLTLTIVSALIVECCGERFALPQSSVIELVSANDSSANKIEYLDGSAVLRLRDRLLPLVSLQSLLGLPAEDARAGETCIVVAQVGSFHYGLIVDRVFDTEEIVVKPTSSVLRHLRIYSGATILGDGSVIMILDFKGMSRDLGDISAVAGPAQDAVISSGAAEIAILVFKAARGALKAAPLSSVARIEEVDEAHIEFVDGRSVIQYRGCLMPIVGADGKALTPAADPKVRPLLVFSRGEQAVGLLVEEIVDVIDSVISTDLGASGQGSAGSLIIDGKATELIEVDYYWRRAMNEAEPAATIAPVAAALPAAPAPAAAPARAVFHKRLLVVDGSPFCQVLLQPLLASAGYDVTVAADAKTALGLHDTGATFDLIMADTTAQGPEARQLTDMFRRAVAWHATPLLGLGLHAPGIESELLDEVSQTLSEDEIQPLRGAA